MRELNRIKKEKEILAAKEREREEIERRRALPEEQRLQEDLERARKSRDDKPKGKQKFLQKYWHKGAFHQVCSFYCVYSCNSNPPRMKISSNGTILPKPPSPLSMSRCSPKSCKSGTSGNEVVRNTPTWSIKTPLYLLADLVALRQSERVGRPWMVQTLAVSCVAVLT